LKFKHRCTNKQTRKTEQTTLSVYTFWRSLFLSVKTHSHKKRTNDCVWCVSYTGLTIKDRDYYTTRGRSGSRGLSEASVQQEHQQQEAKLPQKENSYPISKVIQWTKKMSSIACGSSGQLQNIDQRTSTYGNGKKNNSAERPQPEKPPRKKAVTGKISSASSHASSHSGRHRGHDVSIYPSKQPAKTVSRDSRDEYDHDHHDHHTFATATTASATISYSTDEVNSDVSEAGMEVVMSSKDSEMEDISPVEEYKTHSFPAGKHTFTVDKRYTMLRVVGSGAYGVVISASDAKSSKNVAIKMVPRAFNDEIDAKRILREIKLLKHMKHENIVGIVDMMPPTARYLEDFHDVYIVADLMETDLHRIIYSKQKLSIDHVQYFIYQVLRGLKYIHSADVIHRDLKPSNLLVNSNCDLKICDFGLARGINEAHAEGRGGTMLLTEYVVTRWYRAPEIMLACHEYSKPIDLWSVGCIFAELIQRKPYFPGDDYIDQVS
jgi:tRNA A-37 threonylcarbamoyl transferase component Bud32